MTLVVEAGVVVAALVDDGPAGRWAEKILASGPLAAPYLMLVEAANILRRACLAGTIGADSAQLAHALATMDLRLSRAPGPRCSFETPPT